MHQRFSENRNITYRIKDGVEFVQFNNLIKYSNVVTHCFTTRRGGVSKNEYESLNMAFNKTDDRINVEENYKRIANAIGIDINNIVFSNQVHDNKIRVVNKDDRGKGIIRQSDIMGFDGLVTNDEEVALVTFYADCVPVFLFDPVKMVISLVHSGWRSTVKEISKEAIKKMVEVYGSNPRDIEAAVGPSIGKCCFEVGDEVYEEFNRNISYSGKFSEQVNNKWHIDLPSIIKDNLLDEGLKESNILLSNICTKCNKDIFFSHRGDNGRTGTLVGIMQLNRSL